MALWPGLPQLWLKGSWAGLTLAVGFTLLANLLILSTLVWTEWWPDGWRAAGWILLIGVWAVAWMGTRRGANTVECGPGSDDLSRPRVSRSRGHGPAPEDAQRAAIVAAQSYYLKGEWIEAERQLSEMLAVNAQDAEARLLLATLRRHQARYQDALHELDELSRFESAEPWQFEIAQERIRVAEAAGSREQDKKTEPAGEHELSSPSAMSGDAATTGG